MPESTSRIEPASSYREPEAQTPRGRARAKPRPKLASPQPADAPEIAALVEPGDSEKHVLDTLA
jgi:hypothetical protein